MAGLSLSRLVNRAVGPFSRLFSPQSPPPAVVFAQHEKPLPAPPKGEVAWANNTIFGKVPWEPWNPDELVHWKGASIYKRMRRDDQIKASLRFVMDSIVSRKWRFELPSEDDANQDLMQEIADTFTYMLMQFFEGTWTEAMRSVLDSKATGYSINEMVFAPGAYRGKDYWLLRALKLRPYESFRFKVDEYGNVVGLRQEQGAQQAKLDPRRFIIHIANPEMDPIFGESDLRAVYPWWWRKENVAKFWAIYLERMAAGFVVAQGKEGINPVQVTAAKDGLNTLSAQTGIYMPPGIELDVSNPPTTDAYQRAIDSFDLHITRALLMPARLGLGPEQNTGSFALADVQADQFMIYSAMQGDALADRLNERLFRPLALWNWGVDIFPLFKFEAYNEKQKAEIVKNWALAVEKGVVHKMEQDENRVRSLLGFDSLPKDVEYPDPFVQAALSLEAQKKALEEPAGSQDRPGGEGGRSVSLSSFSEHRPTVPFPWRQRVQFADMESSLNSAEDDFAGGMTDVMAEVRSAVHEALSETHAKIGEPPDFETLAQRMELAVPAKLKGRLRKVIRDGLQRGYDQGRANAQREIQVASKSASSAVLGQRIAMTASMARSVGTRTEKWTIASFVEGLGIEAALSYLEAKAFWITGVLVQAITEKARQVILDGIKSEKTLAEIKKALDEALGDELPQVDSAGRAINRPARLETIARTNLTDVFNQARLSVFTDPDLGDFVQGYEYNATLDMRTTEICRRLDGRIYKAGDPVWRQITPPNHFNCRSILIPVTIIDVDQEGFVWSPPKPEGLQPQEGFQ